MQHVIRSEHGSPLYALRHQWSSRVRAHQGSSVAPSDFSVADLMPAEPWRLIAAAHTLLKLWRNEEAGRLSTGVDSTGD
jgi:hypothetical protein